MRLARFTAAALVAAVIAVLAGGPAWAHNALTKAVPDKNSTVERSPEQVELTFLQKVDPKFLTIAVTDAQQRPVPLETPEATGKVGTAAFREPLTDGVYTVTYQVVSLDGHEVTGSYKFTLDDPAATAPPSTAPATSPAAAPASIDATVASSQTSPDDGAGWWPIVAGIAVVVVLAGAVIFALRRRKIS